MKVEKDIRITLLGDIFSGELPYAVGYGIRSQFKRHQGIPWKEKIQQFTDGSDLVIGNLESPLVPECSALKQTFFGEPGFAKFLKTCGVNVLNVANNHILEHGIEGFQSTINTLDDNDLGVIGDLNSLSKTNILYKYVKGLKIAIAGFSNIGLNLISSEKVFSVLTEDKVIHSLKIMDHAGADIRILCFHWGNEYINIPSIEQRKLARKFIDNGADIIVGHHPHVIQPYEKYKNGHIFYSLGNFIFDFVHSEMVNKGLIVTLSINPRKEINTSLKGIKLSYKNTLSPMEDLEFKKFYSKIKSRYLKLSDRDETDYSFYYNNTLRRNHLWQRILMKTSIVSELIRIKWKDKKFLIRNIFNYYILRK